MFLNCKGFDSTHNIKMNNKKVTKRNYCEYLPARIVTPFLVSKSFNDDSGESFGSPGLEDFTSV